MTCLKWLLSFLLLGVPLYTKEAPSENKPFILPVKVNFPTAFKRIHYFEGYYVNNPKDKGGETYRGIARNFNRDWLGWSRVDNYKTANRSIKWNSKLEDADFLVLDYYLTLWVKEDFNLIEDEDIASYVFEFRIHGIYAAKIIRRQISKQKQIPIKFYFDKEAAKAINQIDKDKFLTDLRSARILYYSNIIQRDTTQNDFYSHWMSRILYNSELPAFVFD